MTIIKLKGGLGNQLFQYAFGRLIALKRGETLKLDKDVLGAKSDIYRDYGLDHFHIKAEITTPEEINAAKYPYGLISKAWRLVKAKVFRIYHIGYEARMLKTRTCYLDGFFQSHKYLDLIARELREEIRPVEDLALKHDALISEMSDCSSVSVHIRRGDYVSDAKTKAAHFVCDLPYYEKAMSLMKEKLGNPVFYIFSDDIAWAKKNLKSDRPLIFVSGPDMEDYEELMLMSKCRHNIIANSSFSFWGAWLNQNPDKIVIAPAVWNNRYPNAYRDLLPKEWIKIN